MIGASRMLMLSRQCCVYDFRAFVSAVETYRRELLYFRESDWSLEECGTHGCRRWDRRLVALLLLLSSLSFVYATSNAVEKIFASLAPNPWRPPTVRRWLSSKLDPV